MPDTSTYVRVAEAIRSDLGRGVRGVGHRLDSERVLAERYGCSRLTIRAALSDLEENGLLTRLPRKGTFLLNNPAESKIKPKEIRKKVYTVSLVVIDKKSALKHDFASMGFLEELRALMPHDQWRIEFCHFHTAGGDEFEFPESLEESDGYVITGDYNHNDLFWFTQQRKPMAVVGLAGDDLLQNIGQSYVQVYHDDFSAYMLATDHLIGRGFKRPAIITGTSHSAWRDRYEGYATALSRRNIAPKDCLHIVINPDRHDCAITLQQEQDAIRRLFDQRDQFDAVITASHASLVAEARSRNLLPGKDFGMIAEVFEEDALCKALGLTMMRKDIVGLARCAAERLIEQIKELRVSKGKIAVPMELILGST